MPFAARGGFAYLSEPPTPSGDWDISTAEFIASKSTSPETNPSGVFFKPDGTVMFTVGSFSDSVTQWSLSTPWDILTATISKTYSVLNEDAAPIDLFFKPDGTTMYIVGNGTNAIYQYALSSAWDIGSVTYTTGYTVTSQDTTPSGMSFNNTGTTMFVSGAINDSIFQYSLSTPWLVSSATYQTSYSVAAQEPSVEGIFIKPDGTYLYIIGSGTDFIYQYAFGTPWSVSTLSYTGKSANVGPIDGAPRGLFISDTGTRLYIVGDTLNSISQYSLGA